MARKLHPPGVVLAVVSRVKRYAYPSRENDEIIWPIKMGEVAFCTSENLFMESG